MKAIILILSLSLIINHSYSQTCAPGTTVFSGLVSVNNFLNSNPNCTQILGNVTIKCSVTNDALQLLNHMMSFV